MRPQRVVHYYRRAFDRPSGVTVALAWWAELARTTGLETLVLGERGEHTAGFGQLAFVAHRPSGSRQLSVPRRLSQILRPGDVLYTHEGWVASNLVAIRAATRASVPVIHMPHGVYEPMLVQDLKAAGLRLQMERWGLREVRRFHVFYESERSTLAPLAGSERGLVIPTGYNHPDLRWSGGGGYVAWFGRYDVRHKGLDVLLHALADLPPEARPWLRLHGRDFRGGRAVVEHMVQALGLGAVVSVGGPVTGDDKWQFLRRAEAYVHPARWDAQGIALIEALGIGVPSIVSSGVRLAPELASAGAAIVFHNGAELSLALASRPSATVGSNAVGYVEARLDRGDLASHFSDAMDAL